MQSTLQLDHLLTARDVLPRTELRNRLRNTFLTNPSLTLRVVAHALGTSRQCISQMVGKLNRPTCAHPNKPSPKLDQARRHLDELTQRVQAGESAARAAAQLGISLTQAHRLGFRARQTRPAHGTALRASICNCHRCRRVTGVAVPRRSRKSRAVAQERTAVLDWLAWADPFTNQPLTQAVIGKLSGTRQSAVSRIARAQ